MSDATLDAKLDSIIEAISKINNRFDVQEIKLQKFEDNFLTLEKRTIKLENTSISASNNSTSTSTTNVNTNPRGNSLLLKSTTKQTILSDSDGNNFLQDDEDDNKDNNSINKEELKRRNSIESQLYLNNKYELVHNNIDNNNNNNSNNNISINKLVPEFNFQLKYLSIKYIIILRRAIFEYELTNKTEAIFHRAISENIRATLINCYMEKGSTVYDFCKLERNQMFSLLIKASMPKSMQEWVQSLEHAIKFDDIEDIYPCAQGYETHLFPYIGKYIQKFKEAYGLLSTCENADKIMPRLYAPRKVPSLSSNLSKSIVGIFLSNIPYDIGISLHKNNLDLEKHSDIDSYIITFTEILNKYLQQVKDSRDLFDVLRTWRINSSSKNDKHNAKVTNQSVLWSKHDSSMATIDNFNNILQKPAISTSNLPCFKLTFNGKCEDRSCKYSHKPEDVNKKRTEITSQWQKNPLTSERDISNPTFLRPPVKDYPGQKPFQSNNQKHFNEYEEEKEEETRNHSNPQEVDEDIYFQPDEE